MSSEHRPIASAVVSTNIRRLVRVQRTVGHLLFNIALNRAKIALLFSL